MALVNGHRQMPVVTVTHSDAGLSLPQGKKEPQVITLYPTTTTAEASPPASHRRKTRLLPNREYTSKKEAGATSWKDTLLKKLEGKTSSQSLLWLPGSGRHVSEGPDSYQPFTHITRTLHLDDALEVCSHGRIPPKNIVSFSSIDSRSLSPGHPCSALQVLWFSTGSSGQDDDQHNWYGNVEFAVSASVLLERWKYSFLVEMMTTPTHTVSRILLTHTDFSSVLRPYDPFRAGGPWQVTAEDQLALHKCSRYKFKGTNRHPHILEFLLDVSQADERKILQKCELSFKNHEEAQDLSVRHVCNRHQRAKTPCPSPFPRATTATFFVAYLQQKNMSLFSIPKLSSSAQQLCNKSLTQLATPLCSPSPPSPSLVFVNVIP